MKEEQTLSSYDYIDQKAGTVRIPIDRAMDLIAQRGLPVRSRPQKRHQKSSSPKQEGNQEVSSGSQFDADGRVEVTLLSVSNLAAHYLTRSCGLAAAVVLLTALRASARP